MDKEFLEVFEDDSAVCFTGADLEKHRDMLQKAAFEGYIAARESEIGKCFGLTNKGMEFIALLQERYAAKAISDVIGKPTGVTQQQNYPALFRSTYSHEIILAPNPYCGMVISCHNDSSAAWYGTVGQIIMVQTPFHKDETWVRFNHTVSLDSRNGVIRSNIID